jgi:hypothetical protein
MKTAIEWLEKQLDLGLSENGLKSVINQAKEMEKQQIIDAYYYEPNCDKIKDDGEQYYNETFKKENNEN